jgi:hypothetical protein
MAPIWTVVQETAGEVPRQNTLVAHFCLLPLSQELDFKILDASG